MNLRPCHSNGPEGGLAYGADFPKFSDTRAGKIPTSLTQQLLYILTIRGGTCDHPANGPVENTDTLIVGRIYDIESIAWRPRGAETSFQAIEEFEWGAFSRGMGSSKGLSTYTDQVRFVFRGQANYDRLEKCLIKKERIEIQLILAKGPAITFEGQLQEVRWDCVVGAYQAGVADRRYATQRT